MKESPTQFYLGAAKDRAESEPHTVWTNDNAQSEIKFSKVSGVVISHRKFISELIFENLCVLQCVAVPVYSAAEAPGCPMRRLLLASLVAIPAPEIRS